MTPTTEDFLTCVRFGGHSAGPQAAPLRSMEESPSEGACVWGLVVLCLSSLELYLFCTMETWIGFTHCEGSLLGIL